MHSGQRLVWLTKRAVDTGELQPLFGMRRGVFKGRVQQLCRCGEVTGAHCRLGLGQQFWVWSRDMVHYSPRCGPAATAAFSAPSA